MTTTVEEKEQAQLRAFTKFVNNELAKGNFPQVKDIIGEIKDGIYLSNLLMTLKSKKKDNTKAGGTIDMLLKEPKPKNRFACYTNLNGALDFIKADRIQIVNISAEDLHEGNFKLTMGLIFTLALFYLSSGDGSKMIQELIAFVNDILKTHKHQFGVEPIKDFETQPQVGDGTMFKVLNYHFTPDSEKDKLSQFEKDPKDKIGHFDESMQDATKFLDIPALLEGKDMENPDSKSVMIQVLQYKQLMNKQSQSDYLKNELNKKLMKSLEAKKRAKEISQHVDDLLKWTNDRIRVMSDNPDNLHPDKIQPMEEFNNNHFNTEKPEKAKKYNQIISDIGKLKSECIANKIPVPPTGMSTLNSAWSNLAKSERTHIDFIEKMKGVYQKLNSKKRIFDRKVKNCLNNAKVVSEGSEDVSNRSKNASVGSIDEIDVNLGSVDNKSASSKKDEADLVEFTDSRIRNACPNPQYFEEAFGKPLENAKTELKKADGVKDKAHNDFKDAKDRIEKVKNNLKANSKALASVNEVIEQGNGLVHEEISFKFMENLEDYQEELKKINSDSLKADLETCKKRDDENSQIIGSAVPNAYTKHTPDQLLSNLDNLSSEVSKKGDDLNAERNRLIEVEAKLKNFNDKKDHINGLLDEINEKIEKSNSSEATPERQIDELNTISISVEAIKPNVQKLQSDVGDNPDLVNNCRLLITRCDETLATIKQQINVLESKPEATTEEITLTEKEVAKITSEFKAADVEKQNKIQFQQFTSIVLNFTPLGITKLGEQSIEVKEFFSTFSVDKATINLEQLLKGYTEYKIKFTLQNKDTVLKILSDKADADKLLSEDSLKSTVSAEVFGQIQSTLQPLEKNGKKYYHLNDLIL